MRGIWVLAAAVAVSAAGLAPDPYRAQAEELLRFCAPDGEAGQECERNRATFRREYPLAMRGDYQSQRNVAFFLAGRMRDLDRSPVTPNLLQGCAWRMVILASGHRQTNDLDVSAMRIDCNKPEVDQTAAQARAARLMEEIKAAARRPAPPEPRPAKATRGKAPELDGTATPLTAD